MFARRPHPLERLLYIQFWTREFRAYDRISDVLSLSTPAAVGIPVEIQIYWSFLEHAVGPKIIETTTETRSIERWL